MAQSLEWREVQTQRTMADGKEITPKRIRNNTDVPGDGTGASPSAKGGSVAVYVAKSGVGSGHHSTGGENTEKPEILGDLRS